MDSLELAPLVFSLIQRDRFGDLINTLTSKVILILGRFSTERKLVLDAIRERLAEKRYLPVVFDFAAPWQRDLTETIPALAHLSRFVVADLTAAMRCKPVTALPTDEKLIFDQIYHLPLFAREA
jgi:hypothetical protein